MGYLYFLYFMRNVTLTFAYKFFVCRDIWYLITLGYIPRLRNCWVIWKLHVYPFQELPDCSPQQLHPFISATAVHEGFSLSTCQLTSIFVQLSECSYPSECERIPHCGLGFHFPNDGWHWTIFHVYIAHLYVLFTEICILIISYFIF